MNSTCQNWPTVTPRWPSPAAKSVQAGPHPRCGAGASYHGHGAWDVCAVHTLRDSPTVGMLDRDLLGMA
jgi:hypothetical protein